MPYFATTYTYIPDSAAARDTTRPAHREYLAQVNERGGLLLSGPYVGDEPAALLVFEAATEEEARTLVEADPFVLEGLVADITMREWQPVSGRLAELI